MEPEETNLGDLYIKWMESSGATPNVEAIMAITKLTGINPTLFVPNYTAGPSLNPNRIFYPFESVAETRRATQLQEERENLILGIKSVNQNILYYENITNGLKEQLSIVEEQLSQLRPDSFKTGELKLENTPNVYVTKLEHAIVESMRKGGALSDKVIIVHHETWTEILKYMSSISAMMPEPFNVYKGIPVLRSIDAKKGEFLVK